jgi:hypothetical protein
MVKRRLLLGLRVYVGVLTYGFKTLFFFSNLVFTIGRDVGHGCNYGYFAIIIYILVTFVPWQI